jgi:glycerate kinase
MARRVLIAPDKFKGTLSASEAAQAIATGWRQARPEDTLILQPISDGGDGFGVLLAEALNGKPTCCEGTNAASQTIKATYWLTPDQTALIESANVIGLAMLEPSQRAPLENDSTGLGQVIQHATTNGAKRLIIGIGGSATNDGGFGMARGLGWEFLDSANNPLPEWPALTQLNSIVQPLNRPLPPITTAVDVQNRLLGPNGCTRIYGPQKGLNESDLPIAEDALKKLARIWKQQTDADAAQLPGSGAAGGLGFGLHCFANAELQSGFELFARTVRLVEKLAEADIVITGEGGMDRQTVMGKGVGELAKLARQHDCRCLAFAGTVTDEATLESDFEQCSSLTELTSCTEAIAHPARWLQALAQRTAEHLTETEPN